MVYLKAIFQRIVVDIRQNYIALFIILFYMVLAQYFFHTVCPWAILTGLSCPACGLTRAAVFLFMGRFSDATQMNAAIYLWLPLIVWLCLFRYVLGKKPPLALPLTILICITTIGYHVWRLVCQY